MRNVYDTDILIKYGRDTLKLVYFKIVGMKGRREEGRKDENMLFNDVLNTFLYVYLAFDI